MTIREAIQQGHKRLIPVAPSSDAAWTEAEILLAHVLSCERTRLITHDHNNLSSIQEKTFFQLIDRRSCHEPIAYLIGYKEFCGLKFLVNKHTLIPRPETEEMIELATQHIQTDLKKPNTSPFLIWDVGTGSGAMAITMKKRFFHSLILASDIHARTLNIAKKNAKQLLEDTTDVTFIQTSLLAKKIQNYIREHELKHLYILANLPYLPLSDKQTLQKDVINFEPHSALFTQQGGNALILKFFQQLSSFLKSHPIPVKALFEFDPPQSQTLLAAAQQIFSKANTIIHKDSCGRDRFLELILPLQK